MLYKHEELTISKTRLQCRRMNRDTRRTDLLIAQQRLVKHCGKIDRITCFLLVPSAPVPSLYYVTCFDNMSNNNTQKHTVKPSLSVASKVIASRTPPLIQIPVNVLVFSLMLTPVAAFCECCSQC